MEWLVYAEQSHKKDLRVMSNSICIFNEYKIALVTTFIDLVTCPVVT